MFDLVRVGAGVTFGLSVTTSSIGTELGWQIANSSSARVLYYLGPELDFSTSSIPNLEFVLKLQHRSGGKNVPFLPTVADFGAGYTANVAGARHRFRTSPWADLVLTGGMLPQQSDTLDVVDLCHARGRPVAVGGPGVTSSSAVSIRRRTFASSAKPKGLSTNSSKPGKRGRVRGSSRRKNFAGRRDQDADPPLRPPEI